MHEVFARRCRDQLEVPLRSRASKDDWLAVQKQERNTEALLKEYEEAQHRLQKVSEPFLVSAFTPIWRCVTPSPHITCTCAAHSRTINVMESGLDRCKTDSTDTDTGFIHSHTGSSESLRQPGRQEERREDPSLAGRRLAARSPLGGVSAGLSASLPAI